MKMHTGGNKLEKWGDESPGPVVYLKSPDKPYLMLVSSVLFILFTSKE